jgi:hypothetical protein
MRACAFPAAFGVLTAALPLTASEPVLATSPFAKTIRPQRSAVVCLADTALGELSVCGLVAAELGLRTGLPVQLAAADRRMPAAILFRIDVRAERTGSNLEVSLFRPLPRRLGMGEGRNHSFAVQIDHQVEPRLREAIADTLNHFLPPAPQALNHNSPSLGDDHE